MHYNNAKSDGIVTQKLICWHLQRDIMHVRLTQYLKTWRDGTARWVWWNIGFTTATTTYAGHCWWLQFCCWIQKYSILQRHEAIRWHHLQIVNKQCHNISNKINHKFTTVHSHIKVYRFCLQFTAVKRRAKDNFSHVLPLPDGIWNRWKYYAHCYVTHFACAS